MIELADEVEQWEDIAYNLLGDHHIENDEQRQKNFDSSKIVAIADGGTISIVPYTTKLKVCIENGRIGIIRAYFAHFEFHLTIAVKAHETRYGNRYHDTFFTKLIVFHDFSPHKY